MYQVILLIHVITAICLVVLVLLQQGRGASIGAAFGSGASQTVFGSRGSGSFLLKVTIGFVLLFFSTSLALNYMVTKATKEPVSLPLPLSAPDPESDRGATPNNIPALPDR